MATPAVMVFFWNKGQEGKRSFNVKQYYHPQCWMDQGMDYLTLHPYVAVGTKSSNNVRGPKCNLTDEQKVIRRKLWCKRASLIQRKKRLKTPYPDNALMLADIESKLCGVMLEIAEVGGIPKKWIEDIL